MTGVLCDGLGHGPLAASAAMEAVAAVLEDPLAEPAVLLERAHRRMAHTRGGAVGVVQVAGQVARFAGLGNVAAVILADGTRRSMISVPGIAGHQARTIRQFEYTAPPGAAIILHSDGISGRWDPAALPGLNARDPLVVAAALLAQAGSRRDDAGSAGAQAMTDELASLRVRDLPGVFAARRLGRELAAGLGLDDRDQVRVATALSEISRSAITLGQTAVIAFGADPASLVLTVTVNGEPPEEGIAAAARLMDTVVADGQVVRMTKRRPARFAPDLRAVRERLAALLPESTLDELRRNNQDLHRGA